jgi:hypothetical protein
LEVSAAGALVSCCEVASVLEVLTEAKGDAATRPAKVRRVSSCMVRVEVEVVNQDQI